MEDRSYELIVAYYEKTISDEGLTELRQWLDIRPDHQEQFRETLQVLEASSLYTGNPASSVKVWERVSTHIQREGTQTETVVVKKLHWLAYAATVLLVSVTASWWSIQRQKIKLTSPAFAEIQNAEGEQSKILLPDSSVIYLAGGSKIRYPKNFAGKTRLVHLSGEAFFDVTHRKRPFIIKSGDITTVVLGTSFNVKAFEGEHKVTVTVNTGKVGVMNKVAGKDVLLSYLLPNEELQFNTITGRTDINQVNAMHTSAWIRNYFVFDDQPLHEVMTTLQHRYGSKIKFVDQEAGLIRVTAKFNNMPLDKVMEELMLLSGLGYTEKNGQFFIYQHRKREKQMR